MSFSDFEDGVYRLVPMPNGVWTSLTPMPEHRTGVGAAALDGVVYVAGGIARQGAARDIFAYDPRTDQWRTVGRLRHLTAQPGVAALGGRLYVVGGWDEQRHYRAISRSSIRPPAGSRWVRPCPRPEVVWL